MRLVVGLGNPGPQYEHTRHNVGFRVVDRLARKKGWRWNEQRSRAMLASGMIGNEKVVLAKPLTYMNLSGQSVGELVRWYKISPEDILVVYDELDLPLGTIRLRPKGSAGGHNGVESIIAHLHTNEFPRLRVGIGRPTDSRMDTVNYVLSTPPGDDRILLDTAEDRAVEAVELVIQEGVGTAMNQVNADPQALRKAEEKRRRQQERREAKKNQEAAETARETEEAKLGTQGEFFDEESRIE
ncbi:MAG TPA: aminoacyl-tRNA hydrolase [Ktedonobacteraceae bacterium]|nr:aminoacyl-tRNA hydrolase [Ktedonobacteraceae bacterium]